MALIPLAEALGLADITNPGAPGLWTVPCTILPYCGAGATGIEIMTGIFAKAVLWIIGSAAVLIILYAAARMITSAGNDEIARNAYKKTILYALLGLLFAVLASTIVNYVFAFVSYIVSYI